MKLIMALALAAVMTTAVAQNDEHPHGIDVNNLDKSEAPGTDFYRYAVGGWQDSHPLADEYARFGSFHVLDEMNNTRIRGIIEDLAKEWHAPDTNEGKIAKLYNMAMDMDARNKAGIEPIVDFVKEIDSKKSKEALIDLVPLMMLWHTDCFFNVFVEADAKNSTDNLVQLYQGGTTLGEKEYYLDEDEHTLAIRKAYREFGTKLFKMIFPSLSGEEALAKMNTVVRLETRLATAFKSNAQLRIAEENYNKMPVSQLKKDYPAIDWVRMFFNVARFPYFDQICVGQPEATKAACQMIEDESLDDLKTYMEFRFAADNLSLCGEEQVNLSFDFFGRTLSGRQSLQPLWKRAVNTVNGLMGEAVGQIYVDKYFPESAKQRMEQLVENLRTALGERIMAQKWMSPETKQKAMEKLSTFYVKIGYPNKWRDYSGFDFNKPTTFADAVLTGRALNTLIDINERVGKPVDRDKWYMTPQTVNAYYNPPTNEICFPAGILQYPFFDPEADDAFNYGAIGVVIGHEMTHGFDDQGRKYDKDGNMTDWWTKKDEKGFNTQAQRMVNFYDNINVLPDLKANGSLTQGENLADHGGLMVAFQALKNTTKGQPEKTIDGFTDDQRFFLAYAGVWAGNIREAEIRRLTKADPHSLAQWRVNGALPHIDAWYKAFGITEKDPLFVPKSKRVTVW